MTYPELDKLLTGRCKNSRKLGNHTYAKPRYLVMAKDWEWSFVHPNPPVERVISIRFHNTDILTFHVNGDVELNAGGWKTVTTKDRLNRYLPSPFSVYSYYQPHLGSTWMLWNGNWWDGDGGRMREPLSTFESHMTIKADGTIEGATLYVDWLQGAETQHRADVHWSRSNAALNRPRCWHSENDRQCGLFLSKANSCAVHGDIMGEMLS